MKQLIFQKDYTENLRKNVRNGDFTAYSAQAFSYDTDCCFETNIERRDDLCAELLKYATPQHDYEAAVALYEAFPNLNLAQASYYPFWAYLAHVDFYPYMIKRFCDGKKPTGIDIKNHWWYSNLMRQGMSNLWWSVKQTIEDEETDPAKKYRYTRIFFNHNDWRQKRMGSSTLFRHKEAVKGILDYLDKNVNEYFEGRSNFIMMYFNREATMRQLALLQREDFYNELTSISSSINSIKKREEAADAVERADDWDSNEESAMKLE